MFDEGDDGLAFLIEAHRREVFVDLPPVEFRKGSGLRKGRGSRLLGFLALFSLGGRVGKADHPEQREDGKDEKQGDGKLTKSHALAKARSVN